jgi:hypothetical protein
VAGAWGMYQCAPPHPMAQQGGAAWGPGVPAMAGGAGPGPVPGVPGAGSGTGTPRASTHTAAPPAKAAPPVVSDRKQGQMEQTYKANLEIAWREMLSFNSFVTTPCPSEPTEDLGDPLAWFQDVEKMGRNLEYVYHELLNILIRKAPAKQEQVLWCCLRKLAEVPTTEEHKGLKWGLPSWFIAVLLLFLALTQDTHRYPVIIEQLLTSQCKNGVKTFLDIGCSNLHCGSFSKGQRNGAAHIFIVRCGLPAIPKATFENILRIVKRIFAEEEEIRLKVRSMEDFLRKVAPQG